MQIREDQESILSGFRCKRVRELDRKCLGSIVGPKIGGEQISIIPDLFRSDEHLQDDASGALASYVITNRENEIMMFFSIRCGELFENVDHEKMILGHNAYVGILSMSDTKISQAKYDKAMQAVKAALDAGLSVDDFQYYAKKKRVYLDDASKEPVKEVSRVLSVYSGVELKFYGINANAIRYWKSLNMPKKMGETLFWRFVIPKLEELREVVGCQYLYLFAADQEAEGSLVTYYKTVLHMNSTVHLSSNKPVFDYNSMFLYQEIEELTERKRIFFENFNPDYDDIENV